MKGLLIVLKPTNPASSSNDESTLHCQEEATVLLFRENHVLEHREFVKFNE